MKKLFTIILVSLAFSTINAQLLVEDFTASGALLGTNSWVVTSPASTVNPLTTTTGLTYAGYDGSGAGNAIAMQNSGEDLTKALTASQTSGTVYLTFMLNVSAATTTAGGYITGLTSTTTSTYNLRFFVKAAGTGIDFGVSRSSGTPIAFTGNTYNLNQTYLITCKYAIGTVATFDDVVSIYVHPTTPTLAEPASMSATFTGATGSDATNIASIYIRQGTAADGIVAVIDGFRVATTWILTIPVEMVSFTAKKAGNANKLLWQTATELNNDRFDIQRSNDGATFQNIGQVKGSGNSSELKSYEFMDETPATGTNYYRLQQVDVNGKSSTSKVVSVNTSGKGNVKVFPTLATDKVQVLTSSDKEEAFQIVNLAGQTVLTGQLTNSGEVTISQLSKGNYILQIAGEAVKFTKN